MLLDVLQNVRLRYAGLRFQGCYGSWDEAKRRSSGYDANEILEQVRVATRTVLSRPGLIERDSVVLPAGEPPWQLLWILERTLREHGVVRVLDFGGSLGSVYRQIREFLPWSSDVRWQIVEQPNFVEAGREFEDSELRFFGSVDECLERGVVPDVVILSSVLQYLPEPWGALDDVTRAGARYLLVDKTPFLESPESVIVVQHVPPTIYPATYPAWLLSRGRLVSELAAREWKIEVRWQCPEFLPWVRNGGVVTRMYHEGAIFSLQRGVQGEVTTNGSAGPDGPLASTDRP